MPAVALMWAAWTDGDEIFLVDADVAELACALGPGDARIHRRHHAGGWQIDRIEGRSGPMHAVMIGGTVHFAVGDVCRWNVATPRPHPVAGER